MGAKGDDFRPKAGERRLLLQWETTKPNFVSTMITDRFYCKKKLEKNMFLVSSSLESCSILYQRLYGSVNNVNVNSTDFTLF